MPPAHKGDSGARRDRALRLARRGRRPRALLARDTLRRGARAQRRPAIRSPEPLPEDCDGARAAYEEEAAKTEEGGEVETHGEEGRRRFDTTTATATARPRLSAPNSLTLREQAGVVESGTPLTLRVRARFNRDTDDAVFGFLINDSRGVHAYGTNTKEQQIDLGLLRRGEVVEVELCVRLLARARPVLCLARRAQPRGRQLRLARRRALLPRHEPRAGRGVANLNASATARRVGLRKAEAGLRIEEDALT